MFLGSIDQVTALVQLGVTTVGFIAGLIRDGKAEITTAEGEVITPEQLQAEVDATIAKAGEVGDEAAGRIAGRHGPQG